MSDEARRALKAVYARVEARAADISGSHDWWPCRRGCDHCCRHLAAPLPITQLEWSYLEEGLQQLPAETLEEIRTRFDAMDARPYTCPLLDREMGACRVYAHRPLACRSYGFAATRDGGLFCHFILDLVGRHGDADIVWANQDALEDAVARLGGAARPLPEWFRELKRREP
ncbi:MULTISPECIES: YkgJ family cysteine cluster protein [unclassified Corallococcus]|uniref:YkgJ family cysteine cluster protein n=1 Tax=unclassified Corallococcus TaxID=2685029 RepID=UPI001F5D8A08|nr:MULTISPECIES: YkgJ family cysteine cluster protein [unclassified Corallococcus]WAS87710.1 YkgJ family cysteine cluster protein [Corallococcus sp. NCRR]